MDVYEYTTVELIADEWSHASLTQITEKWLK